MSLPLLPPDASTLQMAFWFAAMLGSMLFLLRSILMLAGGFADDFDFDIDDADIDDGAIDGDQTTSNFTLISLNSLSAFVMMFGWAGLTASLQFQLPIYLSLPIALVVGFITMYIVALLFMFLKKLTSRGADFSVKQAVGLTGSVYQEIPENGIGKVQVPVNGMTHEINARADTAIASFENVRVVDVIDENTVSVTAIPNEEGV